MGKEEGEREQERRYVTTGQDGKGSFWYYHLDSDKECSQTELLYNTNSVVSFWRTGSSFTKIKAHIFLQSNG